MIFLTQDVYQSPVPQAVDIAQFTFAGEDLLGPFSGEGDGFGEGPEEFDYLGDVVVIFAVFGAGLGVEEVVAGYELEGLIGWGWLDFSSGAGHIGSGIGLCLSD